MIGTMLASSMQRGRAMPSWGKWAIAIGIFIALVYNNYSDDRRRIPSACDRDINSRECERLYEDYLRDQRDERFSRGR